MRSRRLRPVVARALLAALVLLAPAADARAQTVHDVLSFLLTNRSIPTDDFLRDREAADATRDAIVSVLQVELGAVPLASAASGFAYRHNPVLGSVERTSQSFGPLFVDRSLTLGRAQVAFSVAFLDTTFTALDGRPLRDGSLVATANALAGDAAPFDVETLALDVNTRSTIVSATVGVSDRLDIGITVPLVTLSVRGERVDTYRGTRALQASASTVVTGLSDVLVRGKYNVWRRGGTGVAAGLDVRLPTGDAANLLGAGTATLAPRVTGSLEGPRLAIHGDVRYLLGGATREVDAGTALTVAATPRLTLVGEMSVRRLGSVGRLVDSVQPHDLLMGVDTLRLTSSTGPGRRVMARAGAKWNLRSTWVVSGYVSRPVTASGLTAGWRPTVTLDYLLGN